MNRKIKFRIWDTKYQCWTEIIPVETPLNDVFLPPNHFIFQQFTGLKDKNDKEIFEGDIVKDLDGDNCVVEFNHGSFVIKGKTIIPFWSISFVNGEYSVRTLSSQAFEIIGNIFENSKLLEN